MVRGMFSPSGCEGSARRRGARGRARRGSRTVAPRSLSGADVRRPRLLLRSEHNNIIGECLDTRRTVLTFPTVSTQSLSLRRTFVCIEEKAKYRERFRSVCLREMGFRSRRARTDVMLIRISAPRDVRPRAAPSSSAGPSACRRRHG